MDKFKEVSDILEEIKQEVERLNMRLKLAELIYEEDKKYVFSKLINDVVHDHQLNTVILVHNDNVKYIIHYPHLSGFKSLIIIGSKAYLWESYQVNENQVIIKYFNEYSIQDDILKRLEIIPESNIYYAEPILFKLYYVLKKYDPRKINFVKMEYV